MLYLLNLLYISLPYTEKYLPILTKNNNLKFYSYIFSTLHAMLMSICVINYFRNNIIDNSFFKYSLGYFISDTYILKNSNFDEKIKFYIHHSIPILILICYLNNYFRYVKYADKYIIYMYITEIPIVTLNLNWFLIKTNNENTVLFNIIMFLTVTLYFLCRIVNLTILLFDFYNNIFILFFPVLIITILNYLWFYKLIIKVKEKILD